MISRDVIPILNLWFFPVNCTSKLHLGITQNFKFHYRKLLLRPIITMTTDHDSATDIAKTLDVLQAIRWMGTAWSKVENDIIIFFFLICSNDYNNYSLTYTTVRYKKTTWQTL